MSIVLGGITLSRDLIWVEQFQSFGVAQSVRRTLGGVPIIFSGTLTKGVPITLQAGSPNGSLIGVMKKSVVDSVMVLAATAGAIYTLTINGTSFDVIFRHEDGNAVDMQPLLAQTSYDADDLMHGTIKLLTV
jgi:hypothetical protein